MRRKRSNDEKSEMLERAKKWFEEYLFGNRPDVLPLKLKPCESYFRERVWKILKTIPYGRTVSCGEIAKKIAAECGIEKCFFRG